MAARSKLCTIYLSKSTCIYKNLALEEWIFRHHDLEKQGDSIMLWSNKPAVVIGRYQNPWMEVNLGFCKAREIDVVRRYSGGGAVFHDLGNLNVSVLTSQENHDRKGNLKTIADQLNLLFGTQITVNHRDDLLLPGERKISGTAARIARGRAYHHFTLLVGTDLTSLRRSLQSPLAPYITSNATSSVRAKAVGQLDQDVNGIKTSEVKDIVIAGFAKRFLNADIITVGEDSVFDNETWPGTFKNFNELRSNEWIYGKTPKFNLTVPEKTELDVDQGIIRTENELKDQPFPVYYQL